VYVAVYVAVCVAACVAACVAVCVTDTVAARATTSLAVQLVRVTLYSVCVLPVQCVRVVQLWGGYD